MVSTSETGALGKAHVPWGDDGAGTYTASTLGCFNVIQGASDMVLQAVDRAPLAGVPCARVADLGTADGGTSMPLVHEVIARIKSRQPEQEVEVCYEDQPNNDFKSLFYHVLGLVPVPGVTPYLKSHPKGVFFNAVGRSFFEQCYPTGSVHLALSFTAMHWLSQAPGPISNGVHMTQAKGEERAAYAAQAAKDWEAILLVRAAELAPGGQAVIVNFAVSPDGMWLGHSDVGPCMYSTMDRLWSAMADEGRITRQEYASTAFLNYYRNEDEMLAPFAEAGGAAHAAGLRLVRHEFRLTRCPFREAYLARGGDPAQHAKWYVPTTRTWSNSTFASALDKSRPEQERVAIVDELYARYEAEVAADPKGHGMDYMHCYLHIEKAA